MKYRPRDVPVVVSGWMHAIDLVPDEVRVRDASGVDWTCSYAPEQEPRIRSMLRSVVRVEGRDHSTGKRGRIEIAHIEAAESPVPLPDEIELGDPEALALLMREQGITGPQALDSSHISDLTAEEAVAFQAAIDEIS